MKDEIEIDFDEFVATYNEKGKNQATALAREKYNLSFQQIKQRLNKKSEYYFYDKVRLYKHKSEAAIENNFMTIDELECRKANNVLPLSGNNLTQSFDELVNMLIKDRLMKLNKYVSIDIHTNV